MKAEISPQIIDSLSRLVVSVSLTVRTGVDTKRKGKHIIL